MIKIFEPNTINFTTNGITILTNVIEPKIIEELNGSYTFDFKYPIENPEKIIGTIPVSRNKSLSNIPVGTKVNTNLPTKSMYLQKDNIVYTNGQAFRIFNVKRNMSMITINCRHIFYDLLDNFLEDSRPTNLNRLNALQWILDSCQYSHRFVCRGDVGPTNTKYFVRKNPVNAIMGSDGIIKNWGGEIVRDNFTIGLYDSRGNDNGIVIQGGKNIKGIEDNLNMDNVYTRIMPTGLDENNTSVILPEKYIDSPLINAYSHPKIKEFHFSDIKVYTAKEDEDQTKTVTLQDVYTKLRDKAKELYSIENIDKPLINYKIDFLELSKTEEYKNYKFIEKVEVGDIVTVRYNKLNIDIKSKVIKTSKILKGNTWVNDKVELGDFRANLSTSINKVDQAITEDGKVKGGAIWGTIDATKAMFKAMADSAETHVERAILFEDKDPTSQTYGAMCLGTKGFEIADTMVNGQWHWSTFGTGKGFTADLIKAGILQSIDGTLRIDLGGGSFKTYNYNKFPALEFKNMNMYFYDFNNRDEKAGTIYTSYQLQSPDIMGLSMAHYENYLMNISYKNIGKDGYGTYIKFDKHHKSTDTKQPITYYLGVDATYSPHYFYYNDVNMGYIGSEGASSLKIGYSGDNHRVNLGRKWSDQFENMFSVMDHRKTNNHAGFVSWENADFQKAVNVFGDFWVGGTKNCLQKTKNYGDRLINAYETLGSYFGDIGEGLTGDDGLCYVEIPDMTNEIMNTDIPYQVFLQSYGLSNNLTVIERKSNYFIVKGTPKTSFAWELKAKRRGYENIYAQSTIDATRLNVPRDFVDFEKHEPVDLESNLLNVKNLEKDLLGG